MGIASHSRQGGAFVRVPVAGGPWLWGKPSWHASIAIESCRNWKRLFCGCSPDDGLQRMRADSSPASHPVPMNGTERSLDVVSGPRKEPLSNRAPRDLLYSEGLACFPRRSPIAFC